MKIIYILFVRSILVVRDLSLLLVYIYMYRQSRKRKGDYVGHQNSVMRGCPIEKEAYGIC